MSGNGPAEVIPALKTKLVGADACELTQVASPDGVVSRGVTSREMINQ
jgi:hypothetical protein